MTIRRRAASIYDLKCLLASDNLPEGSLYRSDALAAALVGQCGERAGCSVRVVMLGVGIPLWVELLSDRPNESDQLTGDCRGYELALFPAGDQASIAPAEAYLGFPGDLLGNLWKRITPPSQLLADFCAKSIAPGRFEQETSRNFVSTFGNAARAHRRATRALSWNEAEVCHQVSGCLEARHVSDLGDEGDSYNKCDATQRLQRFHKGG